MNIAGLIFIGVVVVAFWMWRRRSGRRTADATERIATTLAPLPPGGRMVRPRRGLHRHELGGLQVVRLCFRCSRIVPTDRQIGEGVWLLLDVCPACARVAGEGLDAAS